MKNLFVLFLCALCLPGCGPDRPAVIDRPVFDVWNSTTLEIDKIEMSDSATVFHIDAYYRPHNWIRIAKETYIRESGTDEKLMITHAEGINLDENTFMPDSGSISFRLFFPPLKPEVTKIDFIESDCPECFKIWGIHLLRGAKVAIDPAPQDEAESLPEPGFDVRPAKISGRFAGWINGMQPEELTVYGSNILTGDTKETSFPIAADGSFGGEFVPGMTGMAGTSAGLAVFAAPGGEVNMYIDLKKRSRFQSRYRTDKEPGDSAYMYLTGSSFSGAEQQAVRTSTDGLFDYEKLMQETVNMQPETFNRHVRGIMNRKLEEVSRKNLPARIRMMTENNIKLSVYSFLMQYEGFINAAYLQVNNIKREDADKVTFKAEKPAAEYYAFLKGELNADMLYLPDFSYLANALMYVEHFNLPGDKPASERFAYFRDKFSAVTDISDGLLLDVIRARFYARPLGDMKFYTDAEKQELRDVFKDKPAYAEALIAESDNLTALVAANKENTESILNDPPAVSQEKMFDAILAKYKGKAVVVDFWATWCGPCIQAMKTIKPLKEEMKGKDVVFLYLTGETSPMKNWMQTYPGISGEHYRVSNAQWMHWYKTFGIEGIPTYMIYDRQGKRLSKYTGFPGAEKMKADIEKAL